MKLMIEQTLECREVEIKITCGLMDDRLKRLIEQIKLYSFSIMAEKDGITVPATLSNGEKLIISKHYINAFRAKFAM